MENIVIRLEKKEEQREVENLVRESFWNVYRPGCLEHYVLNQLRDDPAFVKELDFVMEQEGKLIGQNMFMKAVIKSAAVSSTKYPEGVAYSPVTPSKYPGSSSLHKKKDASSPSGNP